MAKGVISLQKESGGIVKISPVDGIGVTELVVPESGNLVSVDTSVTDNAIARYDSTTGKLQNSGVIIDDNNNVGIGVTPSAWNTDYKAMTLHNYGSLFNGLGNYGMLMNGIVDASGSFKYSVNDYASMYKQLSGTHQWFTAPSGTAGNPITWTNAMTLEASGNLLVGTMTDNGIDKLQVNGNIKSIRNGRNIGQLLNISYNDNLSHNLGGGFANNNFLIEIASASGIHTIPVYSYGGSGIGYRWNALNPDTGSWINSGASGLVLTFTERGDNPNTYTLTLSSGDGILTIQATTKNSSYSIMITTI